ncbi:hypothetical protein D3C71_2157310 [compost metagenome]
MAEYIRLISEGDIQVKPLISAIFPVERCEEAFRRYAEDPVDLLGAVLAYPAAVSGCETKVKEQLTKEGGSR